MSSSSEDSSSEEEERMNDTKTPQKPEPMEEDDSSSEEEEAPPPPPKKKKRKKKVLDVPVQIPVFEEKEQSIKTKKKKHKKHKKNKTPIESCDPSDESTDEEVEQVVPPKKKRKKPELVTVPTSNPNITVQMKKKKKGPKAQRVVIYEEDLPQPKYQLVTKSRKRGRPKTKAEVEFAKDEGIDIQEDKIVIDRPEKKKELSSRQLKRMELDQKFMELEQVAGRKLRQTKSGKVDKRCVKERSPAQIAAARRLAEYNKELRKKKSQTSNKEAVKEVISELAVQQKLREKDKQSEKPVEKPVDPIPLTPFSIFAD